MSIPSNNLVSQVVSVIEFVENERNKIKNMQNTCAEKKQVLEASDQLLEVVDEELCKIVSSMLNSGLSGKRFTIPHNMIGTTAENNDSLNAQLKL